MSLELQPKHAQPGTRADATATSITELVGKVYEEAPPAERTFLIKHLLQPLGVLSILAVANGIFAKMMFRSGWQDLNLRPEDIQNVRASDVMALVDFAQQSSVDVVDRLAKVISASPVLASSAAAAVLVSLLVRRARRRRSVPFDDEDNERYAG